MYGYTSNNRQALTFRGLTNSANAGANDPLILFIGATTSNNSDPQNGSFGSVTRDLMAFNNLGTTVFAVKSNGDLKGGHTYPLSLSLGSADNGYVATYDHSLGRIVYRPSAGRWSQLGATLKSDLNRITVGGTGDDATLNTNTPAISGRELIMRSKVSDAPGYEFGVSNGTSSNGQFLPTFYAYANNSRSAFNFRALTSAANTQSSDPLFLFQAAQTDDNNNPNGGAFLPVDRDLLGVKTGANDVFFVQANGNLRGGHEYNMSQNLGAQHDGWRPVYLHDLGRVVYREFIDQSLYTGSGDVPLGTRAIGQSYPGGTATIINDWGDFYQSSYNTRWYAADRVGYGIDMRTQINTSGDLTNAYVRVYDRSVSGSSAMRGAKIDWQGTFGYRAFDFTQATPRFQFGQNASTNYYEPFATARPIPQDGVSTWGVDENGQGKWLADREEVRDIESDHQALTSFPTPNFHPIYVGTYPVGDEKVYEFKLVLYYETSNTNAVSTIRLGSTGTNLVGRWIQGEDGLTSSLNSASTFNLPATTTERRFIITGRFRSTSNGTVIPEIRTNGNLTVRAGTHITYRRLN